MKGGAVPEDLWGFCESTADSLRGDLSFLKTYDHHYESFILFTSSTLAVGIMTFKYLVNEGIVLNGLYYVVLL